MNRVRSSCERLIQLVAKVHRTNLWAGGMKTLRKMQNCTCDGYCEECCWRYIESESLLLRVGVLAFRRRFVLKITTPRQMMIRMKTLVMDMKMMTIRSGPSSSSSLAPEGWTVSNVITTGTEARLGGDPVSSAVTTRCA